MGKMPKMHDLCRKNEREIKGLRGGTQFCITLEMLIQTYFQKTFCNFLLLRYWTPKNLDFEVLLNILIILNASLELTAHFRKNLEQSGDGYSTYWTLTVLQEIIFTIAML